MPNQYIERNLIIDEIMSDLEADIIQNQCFMITGVRGSGKTVTMTRTLKSISGNYYLMLYLTAGGSESTTSAYSSLQTSITILNVVLS